MPKTTALLVSREDAARKLAACVDNGKQLEAELVETEDELTAYQAKYTAWDETTAAVVKNLFSGPEVYEEYTAFFAVFTKIGAFLPERTGYVKRRFDDKLKRLAAIQERLSQLEVEIPAKKQSAGPSKAHEGAAAHAGASPAEAPPQAGGREVFILHGREESRQAVSAFLAKLDLQAVLVSDSPKEGLGVVENLEGQAGAYAVVLLTPDEVANALLKPSQSLSFEFGYLAGKLGRKNIAVLKDASVPLPAEAGKIPEIVLDPAGTWALSLAKTLKTAGLPVDMNKAI